MRIGVISDTHGQIEFTREGTRMLESLEVEQVLHCGDIGSPEIVGLFAQWPTHFVFGNVDYDQAELRAAITAAGQTCHGEFGDLTIDGVRIALLHSHDARLFRQVTTSGDWGLVCYGHTHQAEQHTIGPTLILNPGAIHRASPHSLAIVELPQCAAHIISL